MLSERVHVAYLSVRAADLSANIFTLYIRTLHVDPLVPGNLPCRVVVRRPRENTATANRHPYRS